MKRRLASTKELQIKFRVSHNLLPNSSVAKHKLNCSLTSASPTQACVVTRTDELMDASKQIKSIRSYFPIEDCFCHEYLKNAQKNCLNSVKQASI